MNKQLVFESATNQLELLEQCQQEITFGDCVINQLALAFETVLPNSTFGTMLQNGHQIWNSYKTAPLNNAAKPHCFSTCFLYTPVLTPNNVSNLPLHSLPAALLFYRHLSVQNTIIPNKVLWSALFLLPGSSYLEPAPCFCPPFYFCRLF